MKKADWIAIGAVLAIAGLAALTMLLPRAKGDRRVAEVYVDGQLRGSYPLDGETREIDIDTGRGHNVLLLTPDSASIARADCPSQDCVKSAPLTRTGSAIACLPHKLLIKLTGANGAEGVDIVAP